MFEKHLSGVVEAGESVTLRFSDGHIVQARRVIGADGIHSAVRQYLDPQCQPYYTGMVHIYGSMLRTNVEARMTTRCWEIPKVCAILGLDGCVQMQAIDAKGEQVEWFANRPLPDRSANDWQKLSDDKEGLRTLVVKHFGNDEWPEEIRILCHEAPAEAFRMRPYV